MSDLIEAPFTVAQVVRLNAYQRAGAGHPFTCGKRGCPRPPEDDALIATVRGWICPYCDGVQNWAHAFMADGSHETRFPGRRTNTINLHMSLADAARIGLFEWLKVKGYAIEDTRP